MGQGRRARASLSFSRERICPSDFLVMLNSRVSLTSIRHWRSWVIWSGVILVPFIKTRAVLGGARLVLPYHYHQRAAQRPAKESNLSSDTLPYIHRAIKTVSVCCLYTTGAMVPFRRIVFSGLHNHNSGNPCSQKTPLQMFLWGFHTEKVLLLFLLRLSSWGLVHSLCILLRLGRFRFQTFLVPFS